MKIYDKILYCRKKVGMSQETLAEKLGVSRQAISKWECGSAAPEIENLLAISKLFGVTTDWLLNDEEGIPSDEDETKSESNDNQRAEQDNTTHTKPRTTGRSNEEWMNSLPRTLGRGVKRFGWLVGVWVSCIGAGIAGLGGLIKFIVNRMVAGVSSSVSIFDSFGNAQVEIVEEIPLGFEDEILTEIYGAANNPWEATRFEYGAAAIEDFAANNPVSIFAGVMIFVGIVMIIGGIILALYLRKLGRKSL